MKGSQGSGQHESNMRQDVKSEGSCFPLPLVFSLFFYLFVCVCVCVLVCAVFMFVFTHDCWQSRSAPDSGEPICSDGKIMI